MSVKRRGRMLKNVKNSKNIGKINQFQQKK